MRNINQDLQKIKKMEIEEEYNKRHQQFISERINNQRNLNLFSISDNKNENNEDIQMNNSIVDINLINETLQNLLYLNNKLDKNYILTQLKTLRKELSKNSISKNDINNILNKFPNIIGGLSNYALDFKNSEIQFETIWVLNNLSIFCYNFNLNFQFNHINQLLIQILKLEKNFTQSGTRNLIFEKVFQFMGKLMFMNDICFNYFIDNDIINILFNSLNSSVRSLRIICLWNLNQIFSVLLEKNYENKLILFNQKDSLLSYKFILSRIELTNSINCFDEIFEIYWLLNEIFKKFPDSINYIFFTQKDILSKFNNILSYSLIENLSQPCIRLISNLIALNGNMILRENFINCLFSKKDLIQYIQLILSSDLGKYDISLTKDILLLLYNLFYFSPKFASSLFYEQILKMISNYNNLKLKDKDILKLLFLIYYRIFIEKNNFIGNIDEQYIIPLLINNFQDIFNEYFYLLIILDLLYYYIIEKGKNIGEQANYIFKMIKEQNEKVEISNLQSFILEFINIIQMN